MMMVSKTCTRCSEVKDLIEYPTDKKGKHGVGTTCKVCRAKQNKKWRADNLDTVKEKQRLWTLKNKDIKKAQYEEYKVNHKDKLRATKYKYKAENPHKISEHDIKRRRAKKEQTPDLTTEETLRIKAIYLECRRITKETGNMHHVDHIKPLAKGGLHHPDNLQILSAFDNLSKGAKYGD